MTDGKPHLLLLPGLLNDHTVWQQQQNALADCATISVASFGDDDYFAVMAEALLASTPDKFLLAGFSMGGYIALEILRRAPERVQALALISTSARADTEQQIAGRQQAIDAVQRGKFERFVQVTAGMALEPTAPNFEAARTQLAQMSAAIGPERFCLHLQALMQRRDYRALLKDVCVPALVMVGEQDRITLPDWSREMAAAIPGANLQVVAGCGHMLPLQAADQLSEQLRAWLNRVEQV